MSLCRMILLLAMAAWLSACGGDAALEPTSEPTPELTSELTTEPAAQGEPTPTAAEPEPEPDPTATAVAEASPTPDPAGVEALAVVEGFDPADDGAIHSLNELIFQDGQVTQDNIVPALAPLLDDENPDRRWAALYVVALATDTDAEIEVLTTVLDDADLVFRVQAAGSLAGLGVVEALPVLIEGLGSDVQLPFNPLGAMLADHARGTLEHYTGQSFPDMAGWQSWWAGVKDTIQWDGEHYVAS